MGNREFLRAMIEILEIELETVKVLGRSAESRTVRKAAATERELILSREIASLRGEGEDGERMIYG